MPDLLVLKHQVKQIFDSPEYLFLQSCNFLQARKVFKSITKHLWKDGEPLPNLDGYKYVLIVGAENIFFTETSLQKMRSALDRGAAVCLPSPLSHFPLWAKTRIYTRRDFEQVEEQVFAAKQRPYEFPSAHLPIALFRAETFRQLAVQRSAADIFADCHLIDELPPEAKVAYKGVYHMFVDYYGGIRDDILQFIPDGVEEVLELGCAKGQTGRVIQEKFQCRMTGVEINPQLAEEAAQYLSAVIVGDVMTVPIEGHYDLVVATDLFEHLTYPDELLEKMKRLLNPGGRIILLVPNVGHYSVVEDLLAGRWDYVPIGPLAYTQFRFFTRQTLDDWINLVGFSSYEIIPQETTVPQYFEKLPKELVGDLDSLKAKSFYLILDK